MTKKERKYKVGDFVVWAEGGTWSKRDVWGEVTSVTAKGTLRVLPLDDEVKVEREFRRARSGRSYPCRAPTILESQNRNWSVKCPETKMVVVSYDLHQQDTPRSVFFATLVDTPAKCVQASKDLLAIAKWWESKPQ